MPFGNESTWDMLIDLKTTQDAGVTNAFRQRVHLGLNLAVEIVGEQIEVTNAFRQRVHLGLAQTRIFPLVEISTSPMPFGNESTWDPTQTRSSPPLD